MSNIEAQKYFKMSKFCPTSICYEIAKDVKSYDADGCVVGATEHVSSNDIVEIRETIGVEKIILFPGIGSQSGDAEKAIKYGGENIIINVGRRIIYSENPSEVAEEYNEKFNKIRKK
jgi:orotidine-5'-phosphate decarboxylase